MLDLYHVKGYREPGFQVWFPQWKASCWVIQTTSDGRDNSETIEGDLSGAPVRILLDRRAPAT